MSGSSEERNLYVADIIGNNNPRIVLCSMQYHPDVPQTIQYFIDHDYYLYIHWLNPGYGDREIMEDNLNLLPTILSEESIIGIRNAQGSPNDRVREIRDFIYGWASSRNLLLS